MMHSNENEFHSADRSYKDIASQIVYYKVNENIGKSPFIKIVSSIHN